MLRRPSVTFVLLMLLGVPFATLSPPASAKETEPPETLEECREFLESEDHDQRFLGLLGVILVNAALHAAIIRPRVRTSGDRETVLAEERTRLDSLKQDIVRLERTGSKFSCTKSDADVAF